MRGAARITLVTPEPAPLAAFGERASVAVAAVLAERGVELRAATAAREVAGGVLLTDAGELPVDAVVALARLVGPHLRGLPSDPLGFVPVDEHAAVLGAGRRVRGRRRRGRRPEAGRARRAAGGCGGGARSRRGRPGEPPPPVAPAVLRGALVTGAGTLYLRHERGGRSEASWEPLWWPPAKLAARHLSHHLAARLTRRRVTAHPPPGPPQTVAEDYGTAWMRGDPAPMVGGMDIVIAGGGVAGLEALLALGALAGDRARLTLVAPTPTSPTSPSPSPSRSRSAPPSASRSSASPPTRAPS